MYPQILHLIRLRWFPIVVLCIFGQNRMSAQTISGNCSGAQQITVGNCTSNQDVNDGTVNDPSASGCLSSLSRDGWYYFVATSTKTTIYFNNNSGRDPLLAVYTGTCGSLTLVGCSNSNGSSGDETISALTTTIGVTYRIRIARNSNGSGTLNGSVCVYNVPDVTSFSPSPICTGAQLTITGTGFTGATGVSINGTAATSVTVVNATTITCTVASSTTSGTVSVTGPGGTGNSASSLTVNSTPVGSASPSTQTLCGSGTTAVNLNSTVAGTSFTWTVVQSNVSGAADCAGSCGTSIAQSLSNVNGTSTGTATYSVTPTTASCTGATFTATITVRPKPVVSASNTAPEICSASGPGVSLSSTVSGTSYTWTVSQSGVTGASNCNSSCGSNINQTLTASGVVAGTATYTVTPTASSCAGNTLTVSVTVNPKPVGSASPSTQSFCASGTTNINLNSTLSGTAFTWTVANTNATGGLACPSSCGTNIADAISSTGNTPGTVVYTITPATASCTGNNFTATMTVNPIPVGTATPSVKTICSATGPAIALSSTVSGTSYNWTVSLSGLTGGSNCVSSCGSSINQTLSTSAPVQGTATYTVTPTANGCSGNTFTADITVNPVPVAVASPSSESICSGGTTGFALSSAVTGTNFTWTVTQTNVTGASSGSGASIAQSLSTAVNIPTGTAVYTVTPTSGAGCTGSTITATATVLVTPGAVTASPAAITICPGATTNLTASGGSVTLNYTSGTGTSTTNGLTTGSSLGPNPMQNYYGGSKEQTMWRASELTALGLVNGSKINSITINLPSANTSYALLNYRVKYQLSSSITALSTTPVTTGWQTIFGPQSVTPSVGLNTITFSSPITWDGTSALLLEFNFSNNNTGSLTTNTASFNTGIGYTATNFYRADNVTAAAVDGFSGTMNYSYSSRNSVRFNVTQPVSYAWSPATGLNTSTGSSVNASPATNTTYTVSASLANGCSTTFESVVSINPDLVLTMSQTDNVCYGAALGTATVTPSGGNGSYVSYVWSYGQTTATATGLAAGTYSVTVTDGLGCTASGSVTILEPSALVATCSVVSNVSCNGLSDGSASVTASGGSAPYTGEGTFTGLAAGTYTYNISDANGCTASCSVTISEPDVLVANCSVVANVSCNGLSDGSVLVSAIGGTSPYSGTGTFTGLAAGTYSYSITDANGCTASCSVTITEPAVLQATCTLVSDVSCNGGSDGSADVNVTGGTAPYTGAGLISGLSAGTHTLTVTDANGCSTSCTVTVSEPTALVATCSLVSDVSCHGGSDGSASVSASGGVGPYSGVGVMLGLSADTYTFTVTDANGCSASCTVTISQPAALVATCTVLTNVSCNGGSDGSASVSASGGVTPYSGEGTFTGLSAGTYSYTVTDANGCTASCSVTITEPAVLVSSASVLTNETCIGSSDGSIDVTATGGTGPYTGTGVVNGLTAGTYSYTVTDANGCSTTASATIVTTGIVSSAATSINTSASIQCLGSQVTLTVVGGALGTAADWVWYEGGCAAGSPIGNGTSISVTIATLGIHTYFVRAEGLCGNSACVSATVTGINTLPSPIAILNAPASGCVGGTATITCATVPGATSYSWIAPAGVLINGQSGTVSSVSTTVTLSFTALPATGISGWNICVAGANPCGTSANTKCHWIRATISSPSVILGSSIGCHNTTGGYSINPVDGATQYVWSVSGNATINGAGSTVTTTVPNINVNFGGGFTSGQLCVYAKTSCGYAGSSRCMNITAAPALPGAISGSATICPGTSSVYNISPVLGAASYIWTVSGAGLSIVGSGTSATVSATSAFTSGSVCVVAVSSCGSPLGNSAQRCKTIGTSKLPTPGNITGDPTTGVCGQTYQYSIPSLAGATLGYSWSLPSGVISLSPPTSNTITLQFPSNFVSGQLCVSGVNSCGNGYSRCVNLFGNPGTPGSISGSTDVCAGATEVYSWPPVPGASFYQVFVPVGATVLTGTPTISTTAVILWGTNAGSIGVKATNGCGNSGTRTLPVVMSCRLAQTVTTSNTMETKVYPNPAHGLFNVSFNASTTQDVNLKVMDQTGRIIKSMIINATSGINIQQLDVEDLSAGLYMVILESPESGINKYPLLLQ